MANYYQDSLIKAKGPRELINKGHPIKKGVHIHRMRNYPRGILLGTDRVIETWDWGFGSAAEKNRFVAS